MSVGIATVPMFVHGAAYFYSDDLGSKLQEADPVVTKLVHAQLRTMGVKNYDTVAVKCGNPHRGTNVFASSKNAIFIPKEEHDFLKDYSTCVPSSKLLKTNKNNLGFQVAQGYAAKHKKPLSDMMIPVCLSGAPAVILEEVARESGTTVHERLEGVFRRQALEALASVEHEAGHIVNGDINEAMVSCFVIPPVVHASAEVVKKTLRVRPFKSYAGMLAGAVVGGVAKKEVADAAFYGLSRYHERRADAGVLLVEPLRNDFQRSLASRLEAIRQSSAEPMTLQEAFVRYQVRTKYNWRASHPGLHERIISLNARLEQQKAIKLAQETKENG